MILEMSKSEYKVAKQYWRDVKGIHKPQALKKYNTYGIANF